MKFSPHTTYIKQHIALHTVCKYTHYFHNGNVLYVALLKNGSGDMQQCLMNNDLEKEPIKYVCCDRSYC